MGNSHSDYFRMDKLMINHQILEYQTLDLVKVMFYFAIGYPLVN